MSDFAKIQFGFSSAEAEGEQDPGLLLDGFIEYNEATRLAKTGPHFLFLGYKGAGKSAIGTRIRLKSESNYDEFVRSVFLGDFPFTPFSKMVRGDIEPEAKYPIAWSWILLIYILESLSGDNGLTHPNPSALANAASSFREMGLSPAGDPSEIVRTTSNKTFKVSVPKVFEHSWQSREFRSPTEIPGFVQNLKELIRGCRSHSMHYLIIDGLDDIMTSRNTQHTSIGALIFEANRLNSMFRENGVPAKIIILCRTDLFERVAGANKNKVRQDYAVELDWYHNPAQPDESLLIRAADLRAERSLGRPTKLFEKFFVGKLDNSDVRTKLLDMTRHTPRDFLQLLKSIQPFANDIDLVTPSQIRSGFRSYSMTYFLPEIRDELYGYATIEEVAAIFDALGAIGKRQFVYDDFIDALSQSDASIEPRRAGELAQALFECSAVGNVRRREGNVFYTTKYRNRHSVFNKSDGIMLHQGLWKALNIP